MQRFVLMLSEALHYSVKLLICTSGIPTPLFIVDTGENKKGGEGMSYSACIAGQDLGADLVTLVITVLSKGEKISFMIFKYNLEMQLNQC